MYSVTTTRFKVAEDSSVIPIRAKTLGFSSSRDWKSPMRFSREIAARLKSQMATFNTMLFGGALGGDTILLQLARQMKLSCGARTRLVVVCPDTLSELPRDAYAVAKYADEHIELKNPVTPEDDFESYRIRNQYIVDHSGEMAFYWNGRSAGTKMTMDMAKRANLRSNTYIIG